MLFSMFWFAQNRLQKDHGVVVGGGYPSPCRTTLLPSAFRLAVAISKPVLNSFVVCAAHHEMLRTALSILLATVAV
jgi:hypothetical protein